MAKKERSGRRTITVAAFLITAAILFSAASCGGESSQPAQGNGEARKLPPGTTEESLTQTTGSGNLSLGDGEEADGTEKTGDSTNQTNQTNQNTTTPGASAELAGGRFTVVSATRPNSNEDVITSAQREVAGDYLEVELAVDNVGDDLVDLTQYSFRLWSPGIDADQYEDYYGVSGTYGKYVSENVISATLLDYTTLQPAAYKLKMGETVDGVFLFYDLNPKRVSRNQGVTKEGTNLVIRKQRGDDAGEEVEINLAGYAD